jgi:hypothetical protein
MTYDLIFAALAIAFLLLWRHVWNRDFADRWGRF